jgi:hypothetical protein
MRKYVVCLLATFLALTLFSAYTAPPETSIKHNINNTTMDDARIPCRQYGRRRSPASRGEVAQSGRQAPATASRGPPPPGSPFVSHFFVKHNIPSSIDDLLDTYLQVSPVAHTQHTTVDLAQAKKVKVALKTTGKATRITEANSQRKPNVTTPPRPSLLTRIQ